MVFSALTAPFCPCTNLCYKGKKGTQVEPERDLAAKLTDQHIVPPSAPNLTNPLENEARWRCWVPPPEWASLHNIDPEVASDAVEQEIFAVMHGLVGRNKDKKLGLAMSVASNSVSTYFESCGNIDSRLEAVEDLESCLQIAAGKASILLKRDFRLDVDASFNKMGDQEMQDFAAQMPQQGLKVLDMTLYATNLIPKTFESLARRLPKHGLQELALDFHRSGITDRGACAIARALPQSGELRELFLDFGDTAVTDKAMEAIAHGIPKKGLKTLSLSFCRTDVTDAGLEALGVGLPREGLQTLYISLSATKITDHGAEQFADRFPATGVQEFELWLDDTTVTDRGEDALIDTAYENCPKSESIVIDRKLKRRWTWPWPHQRPSKAHGDYRDGVHTVKLYV
eukprot:TRINITY_DN76788_c0_g1_i1.p1 TRINITY_DN76788_c0_g1~~TRINITY_DN76788_c0_g1_i1.p1  ORF type:complete len:399 (+),score=69.34 TRINITY_DN76788_c0_g1_i1:94-1290(+)